MFIQTEDTPNPLTLKFIPGRTVLETGTAEFFNVTQEARPPLVESLFQINGVTALFLSYDFISVTKSDDAHWQVLRPSILGAIMEFYARHDHVTLDNNTKMQVSEGTQDSEIVKEIKELLETRIRPAVAQDGGDIVFERFEEGVVYLRMQGACAGCPSSTMTLKSGIENMLRHYIPEVEEVRAVA